VETRSLVELCEGIPGRSTVLKACASEDCSTGKAFNITRSVSVGLLVPVDSERLITRYQILMRMIKSAIETAKYAVDNQNMKTMTPNKSFWLSECRPFWLYIDRTG
jgi:hypothetical protein